ncbi:MAG: LLM class flavin-dependent oxidoreductase [Gammaproteobacteria bacterium]|nr:LLM class flavin-dependent oxidoreductase [Gammaproteobacteria bacterium]
MPTWRMEKALYLGPEPATQAPIVLAALRRNMLQLAAEKTRGAHPYFVPPEHTARARELLGPEAWLCPEQMILLETDASKARAVARKHMAVYVGLPNYQNNLREYGFDDRDFAAGGSDRLVDAIVAWGDETVIRERIEAHRAAGADHVCIQPLRCLPTASRCRIRSFTANVSRARIRNCAGRCFRRSVNRPAHAVAGPLEQPGARQGIARSAPAQNGAKNAWRAGRAIVKLATNPPGC